MPIDHGNLARLDLNLLVAFDAILTERSVTRGAERIGIGQSAMSHNLARLRELLGDELFVRTPTGMEPTPRARTLVDFVRETLSGIQDQLLTAQPFDPATAERTFRIGMPDNLQTLILPYLLETVLRVGPGLRLHVEALDHRQLVAQLDRAEIELGVGRFTNGTLLHKRRLLCRESHRCVFDRTRVHVSTPITLDEYLALPHVAVHVQDETYAVVDEALRKHGLERSVILSVPHFHAMPDILSGSAAIATLPTTFADCAAAHFDLATSPVPFSIPDFEIAMVWHTSFDGDPAQRWVRAQVDAAMRALLNAETVA